MAEIRNPRTKNYSEYAKMLLVELIQERCTVLESNKTSNISIKQKEHCWEELQTTFMSRSSGVVRSVQSLKTCLENMKKRTKKQYAEEKQELYKTGGGHCKSVIQDPIGEQIHEILKCRVEGLQCSIDDDSENNCAVEWLDSEVINDQENTEDTTEETQMDVEKDIVTMNHVQEHHQHWEKWDPQKLKSPIHPLLRTGSKRKCPRDVASGSKENTIAKGDETPSPIAKSAKKTDKQKIEVLQEIKLNLANVTLLHEQEKHDLEISILKKQLEKEEIQIKILKKELQLKTLQLEKEQGR